MRSQVQKARGWKVEQRIILKYQMFLGMSVFVSRKLIRGRQKNINILFPMKLIGKLKKSHQIPIDLDKIIGNKTKDLSQLVVGFKNKTNIGPNSMNQYVSSKALQRSCGKLEIF